MSDWPNINFGGYQHGVVRGMIEKAAIYDRCWLETMHRFWVSLFTAQERAYCHKKVTSVTHCCHIGLLTWAPI
jgi:hypothetical protein